MKFVEGGQLDQVIKRKPMSIRQAAELIAKVARTVHYAHEHGILHRDIKPGNILLDAKGEPLLTDFGLARLVEAESTVTRTKEVMGTPSYMAPEQAMGDNAAVSSSTDIYGLGAVLYQLLTGHPPFAGGTTYETIKLVLETEPRQPRQLNPKIDRDLSTISLKCLEKDPTCRYSSALALAEDLEHWLKHEPILARPTGIFGHGKKWVRRNRAIAALMASLIALAAIIGWNVWQSEIISGPPTKSVAVLPFSNLSKEEESAFFAGGMQDQILTDLSRIADLKVISRTSTIQYTSEVARNLRDVGRQLGVAHVVEGSVQRVGNRVRVSAQLIDARTDRHLWAQTYDRELADVFAIQTDLAEKIASALQAKLSPNEKVRLDRRPTKNSDAYLLYVQAHDIANRLELDPDKFLKAEKLYEQAIKLDPNFALGFAGLSTVESWMYHTSEPTAARREKARLNANESLRLQPDLPEGHLALGLSYYFCDRDYERALTEFEIAKRDLPNQAQAYLAIGGIQRRQGKWAEATANLEKSASLDPKNAFAIYNLALSYMYQRDYKTADKTFDRVMVVSPQWPNPRVTKAALSIVWNGNVGFAENQLASIPQGVDPDGFVTANRVWVLTLQRKFGDALHLVQQFRGEILDDRGFGLCPKALMEGRLYLYQGDKIKAQAALERARPVAEELVREAPNDSGRHAQLGIVLARLGLKEDAINEGKKAVELLPESEDAVDGPQATAVLAEIYAWVGEHDEAFRVLEHLLSVPGGLPVPVLKLDPVWDPLRGDPAFQKLCEEKQP